MPKPKSFDIFCLYLALYPLIIWALARQYGHFFGEEVWALSDVRMLLCWLLAAGLAWGIWRKVNVARCIVILLCSWQALAWPVGSLTALLLLPPGVLSELIQQRVSISMFVYLPLVFLPFSFLAGIVPFYLLRPKIKALFVPKVEGHPSLRRKFAAILMIVAPIVLTVVAIDPWKDGHPGKPFIISQFCLKDFYDNGRIRHEQQFYKGKPVGLAKHYMYYPEGQIKRVSRYNPDIMFSGEFTEYHSDGTVKAEGRYRPGVLEGPYEPYEGDGGGLVDMGSPCRGW